MLKAHDGGSAPALGALSRSPGAGGRVLVAGTTVHLTDAARYGATNGARARCFVELYRSGATGRCDLVNPEHLVEISAVARRGAGG